MEELDRLTARLDNIRAVEPILSALRTISSSSRLLALNRFKAVERYHQGLSHILTLIVPHLSRRQRIRSKAHETNGNLALMVIGSERGLCGTFNDAVVEHAEQVLEECSATGTRVLLMTLGSRVERAFQRRDRSPVWSGRLSMTALPPYKLALELASEWLRDYEKQDINAVEVIYNAYRGLAPYQASKLRILPLELPPLATEAEWPPLIETDARELYVHALELWLSTRLYGIMLESAAAEHTARFQLLDGAVQNAERLIEELQLFLQAARQEAITSEMQDLASGAGLLGPRAE